MVPVLYHHLLFLILLTPGGSTQKKNASHVPLKRCALNESSVELHVTIPGSVVEGTRAILTCNTTCSLTAPTFIWYKNGRPLTKKTIENNQLHLQTVSSEDAGSYSCAVRGSQHLRSAAQSLRVRFHGYMTVCVTVGLAFTGAVITVCFVYLMIRRAKRTVQLKAFEMIMMTASSRSLTQLALSRPHDDMVLNAYATTEETYIDLNAAGSSFFEAYQALDDTYMVPEYTEELYALDFEDASPHQSSAPAVISADGSGGFW
ncbi:hypothetical protein MHYP_G00103360 [Metynnis hypsauchen]